MASGSSEQQFSSQETQSWNDCKTESCMSEGSVSDDIHPEKLVKTSSSSTTSSLGSSTQDSGFASSQDLFESQELTENFITESSVVEKVSRKRKSSCSENISAPKHLKSKEETEEVPCKDTQTLISENRTLRNSPESSNSFKLIQIPPDIQEPQRKMAELASSSVPGTSSGFSTSCSICYLRPKNAVITHGRLAHQATCYQCARRLLASGARCPVCRRKIHMVCKNIIV